MTDLDLTTHPIEPFDKFTLNDYDDPHTLRALARIDDVATEAYMTARHEASHYTGLDDEDAHKTALAAAVRAATDHEFVEQQWLMKTDDFGEGVKSVAERRTGDFKGR